MIQDNKQEIINQIMMIDKNLDSESFYQYLQMIFHGYNVTKEEFEIAVYEGEINENLLKRFIISKTVKGCTERTIGSYRSYIRGFMNHVDKPFTDVTPDDVRLYIALKAIKDKNSRENQRNIWRALSAFFRWAQVEEIIMKNPMDKVDCPKKERISKHAFTDTEVERLRNNVSDLRERAIVEVLLSTWCRVSELEQMNRDMLRADGSIEVLGKGRKTRKLFLNAKAKLAIEEYLRSRNDEEIPLFVSKDRPYDRLGASTIEKMMRELGKRSGVSRTHPHKFRRTGATFALRAGMPIQDVSRLLGHESIETTQIYLDVDEMEVERSHEKYVR